MHISWNVHLHLPSAWNAPQKIVRRFLPVSSLCLVVLSQLATVILWHPPYKAQDDPRGHKRMWLRANPRPSLTTASAKHT